MRVLLISDSPLFNTGYGNIAKQFALSMPPEVEVAFGSLQHMPGMLYLEEGGRRFRHYGCNPPLKMEEAVEDFKPDVVMHLRDVLAHIQKWYPPAYSVRQYSRDAEVWGWIPVQHLIVPWEYVDVCMREYDLTLTFTRWGMNAMGNAGHVRNSLDYLMPSISPSYSQPEGPVADVGRKGVRVVMSVGVHDSPRKMFPMLMAAYRHIADRVDLDFYLHTYQAGSYDLPAHIAEMGVGGHWLFPYSYFKERGLTEETMARIYRRATAYCAVGTGEGLNMPLMEACAMGRFVIYPNFPNNVEVTSDYAPDRLKRAVRCHTTPSQSMAWESLMDVDDLASALEEVATAEPDPVAGRQYYERHSGARMAERFVSIAKSRGLL